MVTMNVSIGVSMLKGGVSIGVSMLKGGVLFRAI